MHSNAPSFDRSSGPVQQHGVALALGVDPDGPLAGMLLLGPSGAGKSSLALSAVTACPWRRTRLVADDIVLIEDVKGRLVARAPGALAGQIELRGFGPTTTESTPCVSLIAALDLTTPAPRVPEREAYGILENGSAIPRLPFDPTKPDPTGRLRLSARAILFERATVKIEKAP